MFESASKIIMPHRKRMILSVMLFLSAGAFAAHPPKFFTEPWATACDNALELLNAGWKFSQGVFPSFSAFVTAMEVRRGSYEYFSRFGPELLTEIKALKPGDLILDFGDGRGNFGRELTGDTPPQPFDPELITNRAKLPPGQEWKRALELHDDILDYQRQIKNGQAGQGIKVTGFNFKPGEPTLVTSANGRYQQIQGDFNHLPAKLLPKEKAAEGIDLFGIYSYSTDLSSTLRKELSLLRPGAKLHIETTFSEVAKQKGTFVKVGNKILTDYEWLLKETRGLSVRVVRSPRLVRASRKSGGPSWADYKLEVEVTGPIYIPELKPNPVVYTKESPPTRVFEQVRH